MPLASGSQHFALNKLARARKKDDLEVLYDYSQEVPQVSSQYPYVEKSLHGALLTRYSLRPFHQQSLLRRRASCLHRLVKLFRSF
jgi:hypothetical protein